MRAGVVRRKIDCPQGLIYAADMRPGWAILVGMFALVACGKDKPEATAPPAQGTPAKADTASGEVVATYQGRQLTADQVRQEMERLPAPSRAYVAAPERKRQFVENLILNDLLFDEGKKAGYDRDGDAQAGDGRTTAIETARLPCDHARPLPSALAMRTVRTALAGSGQGRQ